MYKYTDASIGHFGAASADEGSVCILCTSSFSLLWYSSQYVCQFCSVLKAQKERCDAWSLNSIVMGKNI